MIFKDGLTKGYFSSKYAVSLNRLNGKLHTKSQKICHVAVVKMCAHFDL